MGRAQVHSNADPVALAAELRPLLARNAGQAERDRRLPQENIDALEAANLFKLMTPRRWNGYGIPLATALSAHAELAKGCASTAWVTMIIGASL
jgi:3-hydroxy-9,10-secoandrosta-1,3,5(10)-triene-9,17-dione monooxygenase